MNLSAYPTQLYIRITLSVTSKRFHPVSLSTSRASTTPLLSLSLLLHLRQPLPSSLSLPPSLSFPRFRIRIANETSNYHQRLPRGGPSGKTPLSLSLSHFFLLTFAISSRKQHRQVAPAFLFCHVVGHGNKPNLYLANRSLFFFPPSFFLSFQAIRASKPREPRLIRRYEEV